jgi:hypothetical protein
MVTCVVLLSHILYFIVLPLDSITKPRCKCKSDKKANTRFKAVALDEKIKILDILRGGISAAAVSIIFGWYLKSTFLLKFFSHA